MTLSLRIKNTNTSTFAARIERNGSIVALLQPQEEAEVALWDGTPLHVVEEPAAAQKASE
jgi:hypothetical protein